MIAKILLEGIAAPIIRTWDEFLETKNGPVRVGEISVYDDKPIIDGVERRILHMLSFAKPAQGESGDD